MLEYAIIFVLDDVMELTDELNKFARNGFRVVAATQTYIIMEREIEPRTEVVITDEGGREVTYSWPPFVPKKPSD